MQYLMAVFFEYLLNLFIQICHILNKHLIIFVFAEKLMYLSEFFTSDNENIGNYISIVRNMCVPAIYSAPYSFFNFCK